MLTVHHLGKSQSERIVWLCEELGIPYTLRRYDRDATGMAPAGYKKLHPMGIAPVITDGEAVGDVVVDAQSQDKVVLAERRAVAGDHRTVQAPRAENVGRRLLRVREGRREGAGHQG